MTETASIRCMVDDVEAAAGWYIKHLGFTLGRSAPPAFAELERGPLRLLLSGPGTLARRPMADGELPKPGGWMRIVLNVDDLAAEVERLRKMNVKLRNDIVSSAGGSQVLLVDPSGNFIELFQPVARPGRSAMAPPQGVSKKNEKHRNALRKNTAHE